MGPKHSRIRAALQTLVQLASINALAAMLMVLLFALTVWVTVNHRLNLADFSKSASLLWAFGWLSLNISSLLWWAWMRFRPTQWTYLKGLLWALLTHTLAIAGLTAVSWLRHETQWTSFGLIWTIGLAGNSVALLSVLPWTTRIWQRMLTNVSPPGAQK